MSVKISRNIGVVVLLVVAYACACEPDKTAEQEEGDTRGDSVADTADDPSGTSQGSVSVDDSTTSASAEDSSAQDSQTFDSSTDTSSSSGTGSEDTLTDQEIRRFQVGLFRVEVEAQRDGAPWMRVTHDGHGDRVLFESAPGMGFVAAGQGNPVVKENRGSFSVEEGLTRRCEDQTVAEVALADRVLTLRGALGGAQCEASYTMTLSSPLANHLRFSIELNSQGEGAYNRVFLRYATRAQERFFGFGESFTYLDLKGRQFPVLTQEQGIGRGKQPLSNLLNLFSKGSAGSWFSTYAAAPYTLTSDHRGFFLENSEVSFFDLSRDDVVETSVLSDTMVGRVLAGDSGLDIIEAYTEYAGRMPPLPDWMNEGAVVGTQGGTAKVLAELFQLVQHGCPISAFWLQDWVGRRQTSFGSQLWWNWELNEDWYPEWHGLVALLDEMDIRVLSYVNPFLVDVESEQGFARNLFREATQAGYLVRDAKGAPYLVKNTDFDAGLLDLSNEAARQWFKDVLRDEVLGVGVSGYMADFAEALPFDGYLASGEDAASYHNLYPEQWATLHRELFEEEGLLGDAVFFSRAGFTRSPSQATLFWEGDQLPSWDGDDGLASAIKGLISSGLSGFSLNHSDIGGYTTIAQWYATLVDPFQLWGIKTTRSQELFERWAEANAFTAVYRTHEGLIPEENAQYYSNEETYRHFTRFAKVYKALASYRRQLMDEAWTKGYPVVRHPMLHFEDDPETLGLERQFMLGADFMVAPVLEEGAQTVEIYLPQGRWVHVWSGGLVEAPSQGAWFTVDAPIGRPAVYYKEGSAAGQEFVANLSAAGVL